MLSLLIPIYNQNVVKLVEELKLQSIKSKIEFEIICLDDTSTDRIKAQNRVIGGLMGVNYVELSQHLGRSKIRNRLADLARYDHCLFLDSDSKLSSKKFIKRYTQAIDDYPNALVCGGTSYSKKAPKSMEKQLHWLYGTKRESPMAKNRNKRPLELFHSNNFVCPTKVIRENKFDEDIKGYGYEDLELAQRVNRHNIGIRHIDNPIVHQGIKKTKDYIADIETSIENLVTLYKANKITNSRLINTHQKLMRLGLNPLCQKLLNSRKSQIIDRLFEKNPKLIYLDLYKLHYFDKTLNGDSK